MLIFLDTEFTSFEEPYLLSAGMVAGSRELYFETTGVSAEICSPFTQATVLPLMTGPCLKPIEIANRVASFLRLCGPEITFFCDAPRYDIALLTPFLPTSLRWTFAVPSFENREAEEHFEQVHKQAFIAGLRRHHALDDARALAAAWRAVVSQDELF